MPVTIKCPCCNEDLWVSEDADGNTVLIEVRPLEPGELSALMGMV